MNFDECNSHSTDDVIPHVSIVIPAFNEANNIPELYSEIMQILSTLNVTWEIIFVDDGSTDKTWNQILSLRGKDSTVKGLRLSRNFGHQYALFAGLSHAIGDAVISMDADLQHPPRMISNLISEWKKGNKIVNTIRVDSEDFSFFKKVTSRIYYKLFAFFSGVKIEYGMADFRLIDRQVVDRIIDFQEEGLFLRGLVQWIGYPNSVIKYQCSNRYSGTSKYSIKKMVAFALDGISSFSIIPLRVGIFIGMITSGIAFGGVLYALYGFFFDDRTVPGWASGISIISFLFGISFILLGIIGEYIGRILIEVKRRPRFLISDQVGIGAPSSAKIDADNLQNNLR
jgi:dolichol-phosphate mannosyltransferase